MKKFFKKQNKVVLLVVIFFLAAITAIIGYTYSFFQATAVNTNTISGEVEVIKFALEVEKIAPEENKDRNLIPQLDDYISKAVTGANNKTCLDDNGNVICNVYRITLENEASSSIYINGELELTAANMPNLRWAQINSPANPTLKSSINTASQINLTTNDLFDGYETKDYYVVVWISEKGEAQTDRGSYSGVVTFYNTDGQGGGGTTGGTSGSNASLATLTSLGLSVTEGTSSFNKTSCSSGCDEATVGIYETEDDLGTSYYFRGDVENNYVKFGKNASNEDMWWRIIRINGDGTVRMIYDGKYAHANGDTSTDRLVTTEKFNSGYNTNSYVGYMYGDWAGSTYAATHSNTTNSKMKTFLEGDGTTSNEGWYKDNIIDTGYEEYIADAIYCNDRTLSTADASYTGVFVKETYYAAYQRNYQNYEPTLICERDEDKFTTSTLIGNGKNKYPVGLITADEVAYAGAYGSTSNQKYYLYTGSYYWTMSPLSFDGSSTYIFIVDSSGSLSPVKVYGFYGIRPVISLKSNVLQYGSGAPGDPFRVTQ